MSHEWHTITGKNPMNLINEFMGFSYETDSSGIDEVRTVGTVRLSGKIFSTEDEALNYVTSSSYYKDAAYMAAYTTKKLSKGYQNAYDNFLVKYKEYIAFKDNLTIAYGRSASKTTCPACGSSINLKYGKRFRVCPVCGSNKIISDSNWKTLDTKRRMCVKAADNLSREAEKNDVTFVCGIEWHC